MRTYVVVTGAIFGVLTLAHVWRIVEEGSSILSNPWWIGITVLAAALCLWSVTLFRRSRTQ